MCRLQEKYFHLPKLRRRWLRYLLLKSRQIFPKRNVTVGRVVPYCLSSPRKKCTFLWKFTKTCNLNSVNLWRRHFLLVCRRVTWIVISISKIVGGEAWIHEYDWRNQALKPGETKDCTTFRISSQQKNRPRNYSSTCSSLRFPLDALKHLDAKFIESKTLSQIWNRDGPILKLRLRFLSFLKDAFFPNFEENFTRVLSDQGTLKIASTPYIWICALGLIFRLLEQNMFVGNDVRWDDESRRIILFES